MTDCPKLPAEIVRDLLAIARVLFAARRTERAPSGELQKLTAAADALSHALSMAHLPPDSIGGTAAWSWAEQGLLLLSQALCQEAAAAELFVSAWGNRLRQRQHG